MSPMTVEVPEKAQRVPLLIDAKGVAELLGRSERSIWRDDSAGRLPRPIMVGGSKRWRVSEIHLCVEAGCPNRRVWETRRT
jgi:predicted DNA-binding transcriptional regulator AlpA